MRRVASVALVLLLVSGAPAKADGIDKDWVHVGAETISNAVRVTLVRQGGGDRVTSVEGGGTSGSGCRWSIVWTPDYQESADHPSLPAQPDPAARLGVLFCDGVFQRPVWVAPEDVVDLDALARAEAERYVEHVLAPAVGVGVNPAARGLAGLRSWFWVEGFGGEVVAPPISAFGLSVGVRLSAAGVSWDFGDGTVVGGDLGQAYPAESSVQHAHRDAGTFSITATITLAAEYQVDGGAWEALPPLQVTASTAHEVQQRQPVVSKT